MATIYIPSRICTSTSSKMSAPFDVQLSILSNVDGSARLIAGNTKVIVSVTGPIEAKPRQELPTQASLEIIVRPSRGVSSTRERLLEDLLRSVLQLVIVRYMFPRQIFQIVVQFLATDLDSAGSVIVSGETAVAGADYTANELSCALNCCYFALIDANVPLFNSFAAVSMAVDKEGKYLLLPSLSDLQKSLSHHVVSFDIRDGKASKILLVESDGSFTEEELIKAVENGSKFCEEFYQSFQRPTIEKKIKKDFIWSDK